ncbi:LysR family transcriptional regulator [Shimia marina]|uniref:HTH-type transcriptional regulator GltC n=1 Tax=Shimia marina TaxID=321267 RepID=A0A0P1EU91_9RHOB|nr:LysR family transcriptional regulator [Shimia marina]CUH54199.1 HTH-type transcriptional regulator GltC [Shimia marina]SFD97524.1 transcriptional regulator, LysR family [Shimia marina]
MLNKGVTLRGLEVFEALAATGAVAQAAEITGLSQPAVSQQIKNLERALGTDLLDHGKRPMQLTPAGRAYLSRASAVLAELRLAQSELSVMDLTHLTQLSMGIIDDFDNDLTPRLVTTLAESMTRCRFRLVTAPSHEITEAIRARDLHLAITASSGEVIDGITEYPLTRDPFILVAPVGYLPAQGDTMTALTNLPMLRYGQEQLIGRQIEAHLKRCKLEFPQRFEIGSNPSLMAMVSRGIGWAITTPLGYLRAARFHDQVTAHPLPFTPFSRTISLLASGDWADTVPRDVAQTMRNLLRAHMISPAIEKFPWLERDFRVLER